MIDTPTETPVESLSKDSPLSGSGMAAAPSAEAPLTVAASAVETYPLPNIWARIKEHKLAQWTLGYAAFAFALLHAATLVGDALEWPHAIVRVLTLVLIIALPMAPILAWYHGVRALKRVSGSELILIALLLVMGGSLLWLYPRPTAERTISATTSLTPNATMTPAIAAFIPPTHSIAVLPFVNMSGDVTQEYFSDGISEELLNELARLNELQVAARTSSFAFKGKEVDVATIARKLNVGAILEGSVRRSGATVRITVQLINAVSGFHMWSQTYDRSLADILKVQTDVAASVAQQLQVKLLAGETGKLDLGGTQDPAAYDAYLRGVQLLSSGANHDANLRAALAAVDHAIALDPDYALAHAERSRALNGIAIFVAKPGERAALREQARAAAERAVLIAPELGEAHLALAVTRAYGLLDFASAAPEYERALALAPGSARVQRRFAGFCSLLGRHERAVEAARRAVSLDPQNTESHMELGQAFYQWHRYAEALRAFEDARVLNPASHYIGVWRILALTASGEFDLARQQCESPSTPLEQDARHYCLALAYHALGRQIDAERELKEYQVLDGDRGAYGYALIHAQWGDTTAALHWLIRAERLRDPGLQGLKVDWQLDPIRNQPQFKAIEARLNFPP